MVPYSTYQLYQAERPKSSTEIRYADRQAGVLASIVGRLPAIGRPVRAVRKPRLVNSPATHQAS